MNLFLAALHMACVVNQKDCKQWFAELSVDMEKVLFFIASRLPLHIDPIGAPSDTGDIAVLQAVEKL